MEKLVAGNPPCDQKPSCNVPSHSLIQLNNTLSHELESFPSQIPVEIVSEDEMAFIEAALSSVAAATAHRSLLSSPSRIQHRFLNLGGSVLRSCFSSSSLSSSDVEDLGMVGSSSDVQWEEEEWCEKQMEFILLHGKPKQTDAMKAGSSRHAELEKEVVERVAIPIKSSEESWAVKLMNFIIGANQLLFEGLTRELPVKLGDPPWKMTVPGKPYHPCSSQNWALLIQLIQVGYQPSPSFFHTSFTKGRRHSRYTVVFESASQRTQMVASSGTHLSL
ncbi:hypothetical protein QJS10_CPB21g01201 [Acorus calamus]|uniref:Uncharacterized protein n=1 Tax=Acorus calamus TaxID=4465 RepID=A0AAV9C3Y7_ACOCL|nr:hypothetical protein QJS10_CPB21g01201 [Acorus calamus]